MEGLGTWLSGFSVSCASVRTRVQISRTHRRELTMPVYSYSPKARKLRKEDQGGLLTSQSTHTYTTNTLTQTHITHGRGEGGMVACGYNLQTWEVDLLELKVSLGYIVNSRPVCARERPCILPPPNSFSYLWVHHLLNACYLIGVVQMSRDDLMNKIGTVCLSKLQEKSRKKHRTGLQIEGSILMC